MFSHGVATNVRRFSSMASAWRALFTMRDSARS